MTKKLDEKFIKSVIKHVEDCANPIQLRVYLNKYESYVFSPEIREIFEYRIDFFKEHFVVNPLMSEAVEDCEDILELNLLVAKANPKLFSYKNKSNHKKESRSYQSDPTKGVTKLKRKPKL
jgi:hypothetical protein